jgi:hypothetical protein
MGSAAVGGELAGIDELEELYELNASDLETTTKVNGVETVLEIP